MSIGTAADTMGDAQFALRGSTLPRDHRLALVQALTGLLPALADLPGAAVHAVKLVQGSTALALMSARSRLVVRVPTSAAGMLETLSGRTLRVDGCELQLGPMQLRELLPHATLYSHFVDAQGTDEAGFLEAVDAELARLDTRCHCVCGRAQTVRGPQGRLHGFSLMLHGLRTQASRRVLEQGLGGHRLMGCGVFVPHKSAAAVGD